MLNWIFHSSGAVDLKSRQRFCNALGYLAQTEVLIQATINKPWTQSGEEGMNANENWTLR